MKIRCGSHQQNRSIVRPGLSLMAAKVALTAEEFRENSQRSIALFNTEKLSTDSTHVLKSAYCNSVHFCRCNLHGACGGKVVYAGADALSAWLQSARGVWRQSFLASSSGTIFSVAICTGRVEAKGKHNRYNLILQLLQSARGVWRQSSSTKSAGFSASVAICTGRVEAKFRRAFCRTACLRCNLHGACGGKD